MYKYDCLHFKGYKPCAPKKLCDGCDQYSPWERKILIIKLGALGDVLRTTPVLHAFRRKYPRAHITWATKSNARDMLCTTPHINRLVAVDDPDNGTMLRLLVERFDEVHCYDKEDAAIALAQLARADHKYGFVMNDQGQMAPVNKASQYSFDLGLSDELKFRKNKKSYQELTYESSELTVPKPMDPYEMPLLPADRAVADKLLRSLGWGGDRPIIGLNTGSGRVFRTKQWMEESFEDLARRLARDINARVLLLGGKDEEDRNHRLAEKLGFLAHYPGANFGIRQFAAVLERCAVVVTGDTLAMHLALTVDAPVTALFGSTCDQEVDIYGRGEKIVARPSCAPCYKNECDLPGDRWMACMKEIQSEGVSQSVKRVLAQERARTK